MSTMKEILESTRQLIAVKTAEFNSTLAKQADKALDNKGQDDSPKTRGHALDATQAALEPQQKPLITADAKANPPADGKGTTGGAQGHVEGNVTDRADKLEADQAVLEPAKEPLITADAKADPKTPEGKTAKLANEILKDIREYQKKQATEKQADPDEKGKDKTDRKDKLPAGKPAVEPKKVPAVTPDAMVDKPEEKGEPKVAAGLQLELTTDVLAKLAAMTLSTEEGAQFVEGVLAKAAGAEAAQETLAFLAEQSERAEKQAAYEQGQADAEALVQSLIFEAGRKEGEKQATVAAQEKLFVELGTKAAQASIADLMGAAGGGAVGAPDVPAAALGAGAGAAVGAPAEMPAGSPAEGADGGGITMEELQAALQALVQEGTIKPEEAQGVMEYLVQAGAAGGGEAAQAPGAADAAGAAGGGTEAGVAGEGEPVEKKESPAKEEEDGGDKEAKAQPTQKVAELLEMVRQVRANRK